MTVRRWRRTVAIGLGFVLAVILALWWFLVRSDAPPAPALSVAAETAALAQTTTSVVVLETTSTAFEAQTTETPETADVEGNWFVDATIGSFVDYSSSWVGYRIDEVLGNGIGAVTAVGRTPTVSGSIEVVQGSLVSAEIRADLRNLKSDKTFRDGKVLKALNVDLHPEALFVLGAPLPLADGAEELSTTATGALTVNGVPVSVEADLGATLVGEVLTVVGSLPVVLADHGLEAPSAPIVVSVEPHGIVEFQLFFTKPARVSG